MHKGQEWRPYKGYCRGLSWSTRQTYEKGLPYGCVSKAVLVGFVYGLDARSRGSTEAGEWFRHSWIRELK